jgi:hypothetical protein
MFNVQPILDIICNVSSCWRATTCGHTLTTGIHIEQNIILILVFGVYYYYFRKFLQFADLVNCQNFHIQNFLDLR